MVNPYGNDLEVTVLSASPMELTQMLFDKLLAEIRTARDAAGRGDVGTRCQAVSRAIDVVGELARSLDEERGGDLSRNLRRIYAYIADQMIEGNARQEASWFINAEAVAVPLADAWREIVDQGRNVGQDSIPIPGWSRDETVAGTLSCCG